MVINQSLFVMITTTLMLTGKEANATNYIQEVHDQEDDVFVLFIFSLLCFIGWCIFIWDSKIASIKPCVSKEYN